MSSDEASKTNFAEESIKRNLSAIWHLYQDPSVSEILINGFDQIFVERKGKLEKTDARFANEHDLLVAVNSIAQNIGRRIDEESPRLDARLPDRSRIHVVIPPLARTNGAVVSIRKFTQSKISFKEYVQLGACTADAATFLQICMYLGKNILVSGGTGSGKTTLLGLLCSSIPKGQRIIVIEDASELSVDYEHCVFFETRMADKEGKGEISMKDLLKSSLRLRPDRIIVGEVRGSEGMELIQAMNTGHKGCLGTIHANTPEDALVRLESLALGGDGKVSEKALHYSVASAIEMVIQISRLSDGTRRILSIAEVQGLDKDSNFIVKPIYKMGPLVKSKEGKLIGQLMPSGEIPSFMSEIEDNQIEFPRAKFFTSQAS